MKIRGRYLLGLVLPALLVVSLSGCSKKKEVAEAAPPPAPEQPAPAPAPPPPAPAPTPEPEPTRTVQDQLADIHFDYDSSALSSEAQSTLDGNGKVLNDNASTNVTIEGHCDERGTVEYNLALGDRRAQSARDYLVRFGIASTRLQTISYGEERPIATGSDEASWAQNRRAHFTVR